jgi:dTDP-glucose pyrophosphorylase
MKAVILAAGRGTRMRELTADRPKHLLEVGKRRLLEHIVLAIAGAGIDEFVVVTGHFANLIEEHFGDGSRLGLRFRYLRQEQQDGTGTAVHLAREVVGEEPFLLSFGDILISPENYPLLTAEFRRRPCDGLLSLVEMEDPHRGAAVYVDGEMRVKRIVEKPPPGTSRTRWNNAGVFLFSPLLFEYTGKLRPSSRGEYELTQAIADMIADGRELRALPLRGFWGDIGTPEDLARFRELLGGS